MLAKKLLSVGPPIVAALLLLARSVCAELSFPAPSIEEILTATSSPRSTAYLFVQLLTELLPTLARPRGRPPKPPAPSDDTGPDSATAVLSRAVLSYVMSHPGCVQKGAKRQHYSDGFRHFILEQQATHAALDLERFAAAAQVPLGTLKDWLREPKKQTTATINTPAPPPSTETKELEPAYIQTVLEAWTTWHGCFRSFCKYVEHELLIPFGPDLVSHVLFIHRVRLPARRQGRSPDELALRGSFNTYFPGAQWVGDGMELAVVIDDKRYTCNLELNVDADSAAFVGASIRDTEDSAAVIEAFQDGIATTDAAPLAILVDNRPSNHTSEVEQELGDTLKFRATPFRPQNKAHVEGAFGLFSRALPELILDTRNGPQALARALCCIVSLVFARTLNHRPRRDRGGRSRVELYRAAKPSPEQIEHARQELRALAQRQELARRTLEQRRRPEILELLRDTFLRLGLLDPDSHIRLAIAAYATEAIVAGIAIFEGKQEAKTLKEGVDARYLLGIVRNIADKLEEECIARALLTLRLDLRDRMLAPLLLLRDALLREVDLTRLVTSFIDHALQTPSPLCRLFWLESLADRLTLCPPPDRADLFRTAARRISTTFAVPHSERTDALRLLSQHLFPCS